MRDSRVALSKKIGGSYVVGFIFRSDASRLERLFEGDA
jgi:hypothetical protein